MNKKNIEIGVCAKSFNRKDR